MQHYKVFIRLRFDIKQKLIIGLATFIRLCQWINIIDTSNLEKGDADTLDECEYDVADSYETEDNTTYDITNQAGDVIVGDLPDEASVMGAIKNLKK